MKRADPIEAGRQEELISPTRSISLCVVRVADEVNSCQPSFIPNAERIFFIRHALRAGFTIEEIVDFEELAGLKNW